MGLKDNSRISPLHVDCNPCADAGEFHRLLHDVV